MSEKTIGYSLLGVGVFIMIVAFVYVLLVFTGNRNPVPLFNIPAPTLDMGMFLPDTSNLGNLTLPKTEMEIIPTDQFNKLLNLSVTFFLMGFVMTFGYKIASLGVMFLRPVKVTLREEKLPQPPIPQQP